ncbi:phosphatase PAP2 family protein [Nocardia sp. BMG111209]|uniref:phosphatase PAP2 family protein n=1 Tax=Nocardia sp. BMG111209 TaxID=1160137 RepID=UPI0012DDA848|nr:phosphatase PAP2 family protein [Nocardia sp. BMG111209]
MSATIDLLHDLITEVRTESFTAEIAIGSAAICGSVIAGSVVAQRWRPHAGTSEQFGWRLARMVAAAMAFAVLSVQVSLSGWLTAADAPMLHWPADHRSSGWTRTARIVTEVSGLPVTALLGLSAGLILWRRHSPGAAAMLLGCVAAAAVAGPLGALVVGRAAPPVIPESSYSFPSEHVTTTTALVGAVLVAFGAGGSRGRLRTAITAVGASAVGLVGAAQLYLGEHWLTDVVGGVLLGSLIVLTGSTIRQRSIQPALPGDSPITVLPVASPPSA